MEWYNIAENYPKAFEKAKDKYHLVMRNNIMSTSLNYEGYFEVRDLYDFFDENGIYISVSHDVRTFYFSIDYERFIYTSNQFNYRTEAETAAFTKAFEILENKLK